MDCLLCDRIQAIKDSPYFVRELDAGYVALSDKQFIIGTTLFVYKGLVGALGDLQAEDRIAFLNEMAFVGDVVSKAFYCERVDYELNVCVSGHLICSLFPRRSGDLGQFGLSNSSVSVWEVDRIFRDNIRNGYFNNEVMFDILKTKIFNSFKLKNNNFN